MTNKVTFPWFNGSQMITYERREPEGDRMTEIEEQQKLRADLIARFGELTFNRALEMSGLRTCMQALATGLLNDEERQAAYSMAGAHLAKLQATYMVDGEGNKLMECAKRLDAAFDTWTLDAIEARDGLPPAQ